MSAGAFKNIFLSLHFTMKHTRQRLFALVIHVVIGWFLGAMAWRTCGLVCAASGMGATTQRKKLAANVSSAYAVKKAIRIEL